MEVSRSYALVVLALICVKLMSHPNHAFVYSIVDLISTKINGSSRI